MVFPWPYGRKFKTICGELMNFLVSFMRKDILKDLESKTKNLNF